MQHPGDFTRVVGASFLEGILDLLTHVIHVCNLGLQGFGLGSRGYGVGVSGWGPDLGVVGLGVRGLGFGVWG